ncbi:MAG TPA: hypothetical protein VFG28_06750 [Syntrophales bacterium]|nr:hypothetical protein [Syntrophales bacterium]
MDQDILKSIATAFLTSGAFAGLLRWWFKYDMDKKLSAFKYDLDKKLSDHRIRFERLHKKRVDIVAETYARLRTLHYRVKKLVSIFEDVNDPSRNEWHKSAREAFVEFREYFEPRQIFLPEETVEQIHEVHGMLRVAFVRYDLSVSEHQGSPGIAVLAQAFDNISRKIPPLYESLEKEFRKLLGLAD